MFVALLVGSALAADGWRVLQVEQVHVRCRAVESRQTECEASAPMSASASAVLAAVADPVRWPEVFPSVVSAVSQGGDSWAVRIDLPWPFGVWEINATWTHEQAEGVDLFHLDRGGETGGLWSETWWEIRGTESGSEVRYRWRSKDLPVPRRAREGLLRRIGHDTLWGVAFAADTVPVARG